MGLLSLIKKFVNEGEVVEEELTGDLAVDPIASYESSINAYNKPQTRNIIPEKSQTVQKTKRTSKSTETSKTKTTTKKIEVQEIDEPEL